MAKSDSQVEYRKRFLIAIITAIIINALIGLFVPGFVGLSFFPGLRQEGVESARVISLAMIPKTVRPTPPRQEYKVIPVNRKIQFSPTMATESVSLPSATPVEYTEGPGLSFIASQGDGYLLSGSSKPIPMRSIGMAVLPDDFKITND